jgi:hypothetical protein
LARRRHAAVLRQDALSRGRTAVADDTIDITPQAIAHAYRDIATVPSG